jgi:hypothetical protein
MDTCVMICETVILTDVVSDDVIVERGGTFVLADQIAGAVVIVGVVILEYRVCHSSIEVKAASIDPSTPVVMRDVVLDGDAV